MAQWRRVVFIVAMLIVLLLAAFRKLLSIYFSLESCEAGLVGVVTDQTSISRDDSTLFNNNLNPRSVST
jgi:hypothetical protein